MPSLSFQLPPELWDIILTFLSKLDAKTVAISRLLSRYFNELILNNRNIRCRLVLVGCRLFSKTPITCFIWACRKGRLEAARLLKETFKLNAEHARSRDNLALQFACEKGHLEVAKWLVSIFNLNADDARSTCDFFALRRRTYGKRYLGVAKWLERAFNLPS